MRIALLADIHANVHALTAVLDDLRHRRISATYHLGDLVGYAAFPEETVELIRTSGIAGVAGNYDSTVATRHDHCGCKYEDAHQAELSHLSYEWTLANTGEETKSWLASLPFRLDVRPAGGHAPGPALTLVHGTPTLNTVYWHADRDDDFCRKMGAKAGLRRGDVIAFGHTHVPWVREVDGIWYVNAGSVGRPKDGDARACYTIVELTAEGATVEFVRVEYDLDAACAGIRSSTLPDFFADFLEAGGRPSAEAST